ncbi:hypothetical protein JTB14_012541 [Gonioctena quinquepunctata]|nr:hypothetical protein JTB14_012541 [Gonioctena quinquepunctata]
MQYIKGGMKDFHDKQDDLVQSISFCSYKITDFEIYLQFSPNLIESAHRVKSFSPNRPKNIVIKYGSRKMKAAARIEKLSSPNRSLSMNLWRRRQYAVSKDSYISEKLSPENKMLYKKNEILCEKHKF